MISHSCDFCGKQGISPGDIWHVFFSQKNRVTKEIRFDICDDCGAELVGRVNETMKKVCSTWEGHAEIPAQMQILGYIEDVSAIVYSLPCGHEVTWVKGEMRRCPICGAVNEQWPKVVEQ